MTAYSSKRFPSEIGQNGWLKISNSQYSAAFLDQDIISDRLVIGSGFAGISAAKRLTELRSGDKIILIDAIGIGEGAAGQNSGFMIDVPHNINAKGDYLSSIKKDKDTISLHREAIEFSSQMVEEYDIPQNVYNKIGKLNGAATPKGISFNIKQNEILGLLGPNGCGKTTTIGMMLGLLKPTEGALLIDGKKFDLRIYALIVSCDPLRIYIYKEGLVRLCVTKYQCPSRHNIENQFMHLTNYSVNKKNTEFYKLQN